MVTTSTTRSFTLPTPTEWELNKPKSPISATPSLESECPHILAPNRRRAYAIPRSKTACKRTNQPDLTTKTGASSQPVSTARAAHSQVERRYRNNLNGRIFQLDRALSRARGGSSAGNEEQGPFDVATNVTIVGATKTRKAEVLLNAINFVQEAEREKKNFQSEITFLKLRMAALEKLVKCEDCSLLEQMRQLRLQGSVVPLSR